MLEPNQSNPSPAPKAPPAPAVHMAKWPPDDDLPAAPPAAGGGAPMGGGSFDGGGDGNFKKGRFNPVVILVGVLAVAGLGAFLAIGMKQDAEKLTVEQAVEQEKAICSDLGHIGVALGFGLGQAPVLHTPVRARGPLGRSEGPQPVRGDPSDGVQGGP